jgi:hypothetical protein
MKNGMKKKWMNDDEKEKKEQLWNNSRMVPDELKPC